MAQEDINKWAKKIGIRHPDPDLIRLALTHKSYANENRERKGGPTTHNERLEFLGDAVLGLTVASWIYETYPTMEEGEMTRLKAHLIRESTLAKIAEKLQLGEKLKLGKGEKALGGAERTSNIADAMEALIGAVYLASGFQEAESFIKELWTNEFSHALERVKSFDSKSRLQELLMKHQKTLPSYKVLRTEGPEHEKTFYVTLMIHGKEILTAEGASRKKAEQNAARAYLEMKEWD